jgi:hypothetical protein
MSDPNHRHAVIIVIDLVDDAVSPSPGGVESGEVLAKWLADLVRTVASGPKMKSMTAGRTLFGSRSSVRMAADDGPTVHVTGSSADRNFLLRHDA